MMDRSNGCGPRPWSCSGKVGAYAGMPHHQNFEITACHHGMMCGQTPDVGI